MRILLKIFAAPFVVVLTVLWAFLTFVFCFAEVVLSYVSGLGVILAVVAFVTKQTFNGMVLLILSFLISPVGIPAIAGWLINKLDDLNDALKWFITT